VNKIYFNRYRKNCQRAYDKISTESLSGIGSDGFIPLPHRNDISIRDVRFKKGAI